MRITTKLACATFALALMTYVVQPASAALVNPGFESPDASAGDVPGTATDWTGSFNSNFISTAFAHSGTQSLKQFGQDAGQHQRLPVGSVNPGDLVSATAWIFTPSNDKLAGPQGSNIQIRFFNAAGGTIATADPGLQFNANSPADTWTQLSLIDAPAPAGTATADILLFSGPYSGLPGIAGGAVYWDDATLTVVPEPASIAVGLAGLSLLAARRRRRPL
jgi:MYXO-CTERM domain-containing protein